MRAAGVGFMRLTAPIWVVGVACCGLSWWLNTTVVPWSVEQSRALKDTLQFRHDSTQALSTDRVGATDSVAFDNATAGRMWFFNRFSRYTQRGYGVSVSELDARRRETTRIVAAQAWRHPQGGGWVFRDGREITFNVETGEPLSSQPFTEKIRGKFDEDPALMLLIDRRPIDLSLHELREIIAYHEGEHNAKAVPYAVRYFGLIADTLGPLIVIAMSIPFAVTGVRVNPAVGVSKSIGLFFLYYLLANFAASLATKQLVDPAVAAWLPNIGMTGLALWLFARLR
jgi:lipopolysaccharide export system permease protein